MLLDFLAEVCVHHHGEVIAVGLVIRGSCASNMTVRFSSAMGAPRDDSASCPTLVVVANAGVPSETEVALRKLLKGLQVLAKMLLPPEHSSGANMDGRSPPPPVEGELLCGK